MALFDEVMAELPGPENSAADGAAVQTDRADPPAAGGTPPAGTAAPPPAAETPKRGTDYSREFIETYGERKK
jgi:hypothetical protein